VNVCHGAYHSASAARMVITTQNTISEELPTPTPFPRPPPPPLRRVRCHSPYSLGTRSLACSSIQHHVLAFPSAFAHLCRHTECFRLLSRPAHLFFKPRLATSPRSTPPTIGYPRHFAPPPPAPAPANRPKPRPCPLDARLIPPHP